MGAVIVASRTSPTSLSVQMAEAWGITLVGYARRDQFTVYAHPENIESPPEPGAEPAAAGVYSTGERSPSRD
jgi:hypothetical protein